jgi:hypothetical protein
MGCYNSDVASPHAQPTGSATVPFGDSIRLNTCLWTGKKMEPKGRILRRAELPCVGVPVDGTSARNLMRTNLDKITN